jgi:glutamyl-tRNA synthetase
VTQYRDEGYLPDAMVNYLARLGWSHGDDEIFSRQQFLDWFDLDHLGRSAAQFDEAKLKWVNAQHIKTTADDVLAAWVQTYLAQQGVTTDDRLVPMCALLKDRCDTLVVLADWVKRFYTDVAADPAEYDKHITPAIAPAVAALAKALDADEWSVAHIAASMKQVLADHGLKMPQLAMPVRVLVLGVAQTPSVDQVLFLCGKEKVLRSLAKA